MSGDINNCVSDSIKEMLSVSVAIVIAVTIIATIFGSWGIIPNNWIDPIIIFTTDWLFNPDRILRKIIFIIFGISGLSIIGFGITFFLKNVLDD